MRRYTHVLFPQHVPINENFSLSVLKTLTIVVMDHAEMEEFAGMVLMVITVAVSLDTRGRIVVLVS